MECTSPGLPDTFPDGPSDHTLPHVRPPRSPELAATRDGSSSKSVEEDPELEADDSDRMAPRPAAECAHIGSLRAIGRHVADSVVHEPLPALSVRPRRTDDAFVSFGWRGHCTGNSDACAVRCDDMKPCAGACGTGGNDVIPPIRRELARRLRTSPTRADYVGHAVAESSRKVW